MVSIRRLGWLTAGVAVIGLGVALFAPWVLREAASIASAAEQQASNTDSSASIAASPAPLPPAPVVVATRRNLSQKITLTAELKPYEEVSVYAKISGYLKTINVDYGDRVKAGEVMATFEVPEQRGDLDRAEAAYGITKLEYDRLVAVAKAQPGLLAQAEIDKAQAAFETAKANLDREHALDAYTQIVAPFDGVVTKRYVDPGALIQAGTASQAQSVPIVRISDNYRLRLVIQIPEIDRTEGRCRHAGSRAHAIDRRKISGKRGASVRACSRQHADHAH